MKINFVELNLWYSKAFKADFWLSAVLGSVSQMVGYQLSVIRVKKDFQQREEKKNYCGFQSAISQNPAWKRLNKRKSILH